MRPEVKQKVCSDTQEFARGDCNMVNNGSSRVTPMSFSGRADPHAVGKG